MQEVRASPGHGELADHSSTTATIERSQSLSDFWSISLEDLLHRLGSTLQGLSAEEARRILAGGPSRFIKVERWMQILPLLMAPFKSPIILILLIAAGLSLFLG